MDNIVQEFDHNGWKVYILIDDECSDLNPMDSEGNLGHVINNRNTDWRRHYGERAKEEYQILQMMQEEADEYFFFPFNAGEVHGPGSFTVDFTAQRQVPSGVVRVSKKQAREDWPEVKNEAKLKELCLERVKGEAQEFCHWANGEVYGYLIKHPQTGKEVASCWGFIGDPVNAVDAAKEHIGDIKPMTQPPSDLKEAIEAFLERNESGAIAFAKVKDCPKAMVVLGESHTTYALLDNCIDLINEDFVPEEIK